MDNKLETTHEKAAKGSDIILGWFVMYCGYCDCDKGNSPEIFAVGPFDTLLLAKYWFAGVKDADNEWIVPGTIVYGLMPSTSVTLTDPKIILDCENL